MNRFSLDLGGNNQKNLRKKIQESHFGPNLASFCPNFKKTNIVDKIQ